MWIASWPNRFLVLQQRNHLRILVSSARAIQAQEEQRFLVVLDEIGMGDT